MQVQLQPSFLQLLLSTKCRQSCSWSSVTTTPPPPHRALLPQTPCFPESGMGEVGAVPSPRTSRTFRKVQSTQITWQTVRAVRNITGSISILSASPKAKVDELYFPSPRTQELNKHSVLRDGLHGMVSAQSGQREKRG